MMLLRPVLLLLLCFGLSRTGSAQTLPIGDPFETYLRIAPVSAGHHAPSFNHRPIDLSSYREWIGLQTAHPWSGHPFFLLRDTDPKPEWFRLHAPRLTSTWNSRFAFGQNDGAMWQGRGTNLAFSLGGSMEYGPLHIELRPEVGYSRNSDFALSPLSDRTPLGSGFGFPYERIDTPQRFGNEPLSWIHPGQSTVRLQFRGATVGASTANIWSGPAMHNPLILSNNAPGFFHLFLGSYRPIRTPVGYLEGRIYWGELRESGWFDNDPNNDIRFVNGLIFNYTPSFAPNFHLGLTRTQYEYIPDGIGWEQIFRFARGFWLSDQNQAQNITSQMLSFFGRFAFPEYGVEFYFEWGRNDHAVDLRDFTMQPEHARAYMIGLLKRFELSGNRWITLNFEMTQLEHEKTHSTRIAGPWYQHSRRIQGWTHLGQVLGAGIETGSNNQYLDLRLILPQGMGGVSFNRVIHHNDGLRRRFSQIRNIQQVDRNVSIRELQQVEFRFGLHGLYFLPYNLELQADLYQSRFVNRHNIFENNVWNTNVALTLRYALPGMLR